MMLFLGINAYHTGKMQKYQSLFWCVWGYVWKIVAWSLPGEPWIEMTLQISGYTMGPYYDVLYLFRPQEEAGGTHRETEGLLFLCYAYSVYFLDSSCILVVPRRGLCSIGHRLIFQNTTRIDSNFVFIHPAYSKGSPWPDCLDHRPIEMRGEKFLPCWKLNGGRFLIKWS